MRDITTIELKRDTHKKLLVISNKSESFDEVVNRLIDMKQHVDEYIQNYIDEKNGECILTTLFGRTIIANHNFETVCGNAKCTKCGLSAPITIKNNNMITTISIGNNDGFDINFSKYNSFGDVIKEAINMLPDGGIIKLPAGEYNLGGCNGDRQ